MRGMLKARELANLAANLGQTFVWLQEPDPWITDAFREKLFDDKAYSVDLPGGHRMFTNSEAVLHALREYKDSPLDEPGFVGGSSSGRWNTSPANGSLMSS